MKKILYSVVFMFLIALVFTSLVSAVKLSHEERILRNQQAKLQKTILKVLGIPVRETIPPKELFRLFEARIETITFKDNNIYVGYGEKKEAIQGYAFPVGGPGFWGPIHGMVGVDPTASGIIGLAFYKHSETPGLGGRVSEAWFTEQFTGLPLYPVEGTEKIFHLTPRRVGKASNELDAITGASRTRHAVEQFLNQELDRFLGEFSKLD